MKKTAQQKVTKAAARNPSAKAAPARKATQLEPPADSLVTGLELLSSSLDQLFASQGFILKVR